MQLPIPDHPPLALDQPRIMGILNVTPDSFSDGGQFDATDLAVSHAHHLLDQGADIIDVGGESTRPGAQRVPATQQLERILPVITELAKMIRRRTSPALISVDTTLAPVADAALAAGAHIINDISAGRDDPDLLPLVADRRAPIVLMHMQGTPATMQNRPHYDDVVTEVRDFLLSRAAHAQSRGIAREAIILDPGIGFGKTTEHNLRLLANLRTLVQTGFPVLLGASRKRFLASLAHDAPEDDRLGGTCAATALAVQQGVHILRVHDVDPNRQAAALAHTLKTTQNAPR